MIRITWQEITIYLQNKVGCLHFLIAYLSFGCNKTYEPPCIYNKNEQQVYNKMHTGKWWYKQQKEYLSQAIIISILISSNKMLLNFSHGDQILWPVYITIGNQDAKTWQSEKWLRILLLSSIPIIHE